ncbi:glutaminyl-tRNA synthetase [Thelephora terrestris]|uniref:glutamine--tRNA ligase n=1 Tax=Thelephora terrestris TaxID=56493 RepID=A0A9P6L309_9AGAM|nr:glutaminyl-tRNA synthetase [Thelephora terrestris]
MPPKPTLTTEEIDVLAEKFETIGLNQAKAKDAAKSPKIAEPLKHLVETFKLAERSVSDKQASLLVHFAPPSSKLSNDQERKYIVDRIIDGKLKSTDQVNAAIKYFETHSLPVDDSAFDEECGVGFSITPEDLYARATSYVTANAVSGWQSLSAVIGGLKTTPDLRWANPLDLKNAVEKAFVDTFGRKEDALAKLKAEKAKDVKKPTSKDSTSESVQEPSVKTVFEQGFLGGLHKPGGNPQIKPELREKHLAATGGQVWTRFPPEPNGYLHIGHSKAIFVDFGYAAHHGGKTYLRYDDTNPEAEEGRYFESILETVRWLGYEPWKITYSSDYFDQLYNLAVELIKRDKGYVCLCTPEEIHANRGGEKSLTRKACLHRTRPVADSLADFQKMKEGEFAPGEAVLRMKQDLESGNPQMWDLIAYRVLLSPHHRTGDRWKVYPTYDFTHCLVDSFENISHSLCTVEFVLSRESYDWLCDVLEVYKPRQSEFGRLNVTGTVMSKRKILKLVKEGYIRDWDDPRLYTLIALRRRGVPPGAILSFVSTLGVSTSTTAIQVTRLEQTIRQYLENSVPRLLMVLRPLKVTIENLEEDHISIVEKPLHPKVPELGNSKVPFTKTIYIESEDFRLEDSKDYFRLAPGKTVGLFGVPHPITCTSYKTDPATSTVVEVIARLENSGQAKKPKAFIQWVAEHAPSGSPIRVDEARIFHQLFKSDNPAASPDYLADINPDSLEVVKGALLETGFLTLAKKLWRDAIAESTARTEKALKENETRVNGTDDDTPRATSDQLVGKECIRFQGLRVAYFAVDKDSTLRFLEEGDDVVPVLKDGDSIVLNRIVSLKEDAGKTA